ncbi:unnamed protein product [Arabidopsis halleri]
MTKITHVKHSLTFMIAKRLFDKKKKEISFTYRCISKNHFQCFPCEIRVLCPRMHNFNLNFPLCFEGLNVSKIGEYLLSCHFFIGFVKW